MKFFHIRQENEDYKLVRHYSNSAEPLSEGILGRSFRKIKDTVATVVAATMFFTAVGAAHFRCSSSQEESDETGQSSQANQTISKTGKTDENGKAVFEANGKTYEINLFDRESGNPIAGMNVILSIKGDGGFYIVLDSSGTYIPRIAGLGKPSDEKTDSSSIKKVSNVVMHKQGGVCQLPAGFFSTVDLSTDEGMAKLDDWHEEWKKDKGTENPLTENFENKAEVVLSELNDKIRYILQHIIGDTTARATAEIPIYFGLIKLGKAISTLFSKANSGLFIMDICAMSEQLDWAGYYKGLCYENSDKFEVWKLKAANYFEVDPIIQNPILLVLPVQSKNNWTVPVAGISGKVVYESPEEQFFGMIYSEVELRHVDGKLPTIKSETPLFYPGISETTFSFVASACGNINPTYELKVNYAGSYGEGGEPKFMLTVEEGVEYTVNFKVKKDCTGGYTSKTTGTNGFEVVCKSDSISQNKINCENTVIEACDGIKVIAKYSSSIWSCPAIDTDGNLYVQTGNILTEEDSLIALTSNLSERWSIKGIDFVNFGTLPGIQPIISQTSNTIYVIYFSTLYSIANNGTINWDLGTTGLSIDGLAIGANETIYVVSGFDIYAISPTGNILWSVYLNTSFIQPTVDLDGNLYLGQDSPGLIFKFLPDSTYQSWQLPSSITDAISEFAIANDNIYVGTTEGLYALNRESGAAQLKFDTTTAIDGAGSEITTPPSFDSAGNIYFGVNNWLFSITQQGDLRWKKQTSAFITQPTIASNDVIYFINVGYPAELRAIRSDGSDILTTNINSGNYCPAYISKNGTIYITNTSEIYAIEGSSPLMNSPWPMYRHDPQNSGNAGTPLK